MFNLSRLARLVATLAVCAGLLAGCENVQAYPDPRHEPVAPSTQATVEPGYTPPARQQANVAQDVDCEPALAQDHLPPRSNVMTRVTSANPAVGVLTDDLFEQFSSHCQGCHVDTNLGNFQVARRNFADPEKKQQLQQALTRIRSDDPALVMPPPPVGKPFKERAADDPVRGFAQLLEAWLQAGRPNDLFYPNQQSAGAAATYFVPKAIAEQMTNLGNCVSTSKLGFASEQERSAQLDAMFTQASALPERLDQTDLFTLDSKELARYGVVAFAPAYTLWADNAKKIRMVRVPRGQSIEFDAETQSFAIPPNTRFYKTFLKRVIDKEGRVSYRKMETRLILSRPDDPSKDGPERHTALFGTYAWNEQETEAVLVRDPLRNGKAFRDRLVTYYLDEQKVEALVRAGEQNLDSTLRDQGLSRKYAIPGSERCIRCHMGSASESFVLGFMPLQINRRPKGEGGVIEPSDEGAEVGAHELNQLERLIEYGVITGMSSADEVTLLEQSQGEREPRNEYELDAQGYMLGNCAHCHNPRGFPTYAAPELRDLLNFLPGEKGGIFQFPLERTSPRIYRGADQNVPIPYITPSLYDMPSGYVDANHPKIRTKQVQTPDGEVGVVAADEAPWRSLIYRNVDTPFSYSDDDTIFPHMPRDTPGYDCRARRLLGSWMVSIPARWQTQLTDADADNAWDFWVQAKPFWKPSVRSDVPNPGPERQAAFADPQPYVEVKPGELGYVSSAVEAESRLETFEQSARYQDCPEGLAAPDIQDPEIVQGYRTVPQPESGSIHDGWGLIGEIVPERPHWFVMDLTEPAVAWSPRRSDWESIVVHQEVPVWKSTMSDFEKAKVMNDRKTIYVLTGVDAWRGKLAGLPEYLGLSEYPITDRDVRITSALRQFALSPFPLGLWQAKPECSDACKLAAEPKVSDFTGDSRPRWLDWASGSPDFSPASSDAAVYTIAPGAQVFGSVCANCHGPLADSRGRMADTIADLTGGDTRVANLRDGILGPVEAPGENRGRVFDIKGNVSSEDWAVRYLLWMGLGGTQRVIPEPVLHVVGTTRVLGQRRQGLAQLGDVGANMLAVPEYLCSRLVRGNVFFDVARGALHQDNMYPERAHLGRKPSLPFFSTNGDAELWEQLCTVDNPAPVRVIWLNPERPDGLMVQQWLYARSAYPTGAPVGDQRGRVQSGLRADNTFPWCLQQPATEDARSQLLALYRQERPGDSEPPPFCPDALLASDGNRFVNADPDGLWQRRAAMNAGMAVFAYLDGLAHGTESRRPDFDRCEDLPRVDSCAEAP